jgi:nucleoside-diphosphate-sugar epimerase
VSAPAALPPAGAPVAAVTGGTGFIGGHVIAALAASGWRVRLLLRRMPRLAGTETPVEAVPGRLDEPEALRRLVDGAAAVVHLAGAVSARGPREFMAINRDGTAALAAAWREAAPEARFVLLSSLAARAPAVSPYAASKAAGEAALDAAPARCAAAILRPGAVYGPGDRAALGLLRTAFWPVQPVPAVPAARIALVHARDLAGAVAAFARPDAPGGLFEIADGRPEGHGWRDIVEAACMAAGRRARPVGVPLALLHPLGRLGDLRARLGAAAMLTSGKLGEIAHGDWAAHAARLAPRTLWAPEIALAQGFAETLAWYRQAGWLDG